MALLGGNKCGAHNGDMALVHTTGTWHLAKNPFGGIAMILARSFLLRAECSQGKQVSTGTWHKFSRGHGTVRKAGMAMR